MKREKNDYGGEYPVSTDSPGGKEKISGEEAFLLMYGEEGEYPQDAKEEFLELYCMIALLGY